MDEKITKEELKEYLKNNLSVKLEVLGGDYGSSKSFVISLLLNNELISYDSYLLK